jgi:hypothetical protein
MTIGQLVDAYNTGEVIAETYVWTEGMADWAQLGQVAEIVDALYAAAGAGGTSDGYAAAAQPAYHQPAAEPSSPWSEHPHAGSSAGRAAVAGARGQDLFGRYAVAGSEEEVTTSAPQDMAPPAAATGARNESSVLFSLSALTASAGSTAPMMSAPPPTDSNDDSGLIDLKALTAAAEQPKADPAAGMGSLGLGSPLGVSGPLGMPAPPQPVATDLGPVQYPAAKNRTGLFVGGAIALGAVIIALALILKPEPPPPVVPTVDTSLVAQPVLPTATQQELVAQPPPTTGDEADAGPEKKKTTRRWRRRTSTKQKTETSGSSSSSTSSSTRSSKAPKKAAGPCGCAPGDLMCNMKCSAKGGG